MALRILAKHLDLKVGNMPLPVSLCSLSLPRRHPDPSLPHIIFDWKHIF
jgi:hypothetical protein